jgi:ABC-type bacteriocin/lantibiotic exporter with double-glycine peptidase domain
MRRVPFIPQMEVADCGAACLAMVLATHGHHAPAGELRDACGLARGGVTARRLADAASAYGLDVDAFRVEPEELAELPTPAILHWDMNHFVVLERMRAASSPAGAAIIVDPSVGRLTVTRAELDRRFTGVVLTFRPNASFARRRSAPRRLALHTGTIRNNGAPVVQLVGFALMTQLLAAAAPLLNQVLIDHAGYAGEGDWLTIVALTLISSIAVRAAIGVARGWTLSALHTRLATTIMARTIEQLVALPLAYFSRRRPGDLFQRIQSTSTVASLFTATSVSALLDSLLLLTYAAVMVAYSPRIGTLVVFLALARVAAMAAFRGRSRQSMRGELAAAGRETSLMLETIDGLEGIRACGADAIIAERWTSRITERMNRALERRRIEIAADAVTRLFGGATIAVVVFLGGTEVLAGRWTIGAFSSFLMLQALFVAPLESLVSMLGRWQYVDNHLARIEEITTATPERRGGARVELRGGITLEAVGFRHGSAAPFVLRDVHVDVAPGRKIGIVGPTGAGKTTLARLMAGLDVPTEGSVLYDGAPLDELELEHVRRQIGVVLQDAHLFNDTVRANITMHDATIPLEQIEEAARLACIDDVIDALPDGYETRIGDGGIALSGGERQRIALAGALVHRPRILVLDEATSALDVETERRVQDNLSRVGATQIVIAHRLATVGDADVIFVVEEGGVRRCPNAQNRSAG